MVHGHHEGGVAVAFFGGFFYPVDVPGFFFVGFGFANEVVAVGIVGVGFVGLQCVKQVL